MPPRSKCRRGASCWGSEKLTWLSTLVSERFPEDEELRGEIGECRERKEAREAAKESVRKRRRMLTEALEQFLWIAGDRRPQKACQRTLLATIFQHASSQRAIEYVRKCFANHLVSNKTVECVLRAEAQGALTKAMASYKATAAVVRVRTRRNLLQYMSLEPAALYRETKHWVAPLVTLLLEGTAGLEEQASDPTGAAAPGTGLTSEGKATEASETGPQGFYMYTMRNNSKDAGLSTCLCER